MRLKGATDAELLCAGRAAMAVFEKAGVTPVQAAEAAFARARAAAKAGCAQWPAGAEPETAELEIVGVPEVDDDDEAEKRQMLAIHLAAVTGREPNKAELDAEYEALIAEMNKAAVSRSA